MKKRKKKRWTAEEKYYRQKQLDEPVEVHLCGQFEQARSNEALLRHSRCRVVRKGEPMS